MNAGALKDIVRLCAEKQAQTENGEIITEYEKTAKIYANVQTFGAKRLIEYERELTDNMISVMIRFRKNINLKQALFWQNKYYRILNVSCKKEKDYCLLNCELIGDGDNA